MGAILCGDALDKRALLALGTGRRITPNLPVVMDGLDRCLCVSLAGRPYGDCGDSNDHDQRFNRKEKRFWTY